MKNNSIRLSVLLLFLIFFMGCSHTKVNKEADYALLRGINYSQKGEYEKAMEEYSKSYELNPENIVLLKELGYMEYSFENYKKAEEYWLKALSYTSKDEDLIKNLVTLYFEEGDYSKSIEMMKKSYNPNGDYYKKIKSLIAFYENDYQKSYNLFKEMAVSSFDNESILVYINILRKLDKKEELFHFLKDTYPYYSNNKRYVIECSKILSEDFKLNENSEKILIDYLLENGNDDEILLQLSILYLKMGKKEKADDSFKLISEKGLFNLEYQNLKKNLN